MRSSCIYRRSAGSMEILIGRHNVTKNNAENHEQVRNVISKFEHPKFNPSNLYFDFSLLKLEKAVEINDFVEPACLPSTTVSKNQHLNNFSYACPVKGR